MLFLSGKLSVNYVGISGTNLLNNSEIKSKIWEQMDGNYLKYFSKKNLILVKAGYLEKMLKNDYKLIKDVKIKKKFPSALQIDIAERKLMLVFCNSSGCFSLDESGIAFEKISYGEANEKQVSMLEDRHDENIGEGENIVDAENIEYITSIAPEMASALGINVEKQYETPNRISGDIRAKTTEGWSVYFNQNIELKKEVEMLRLVLTSKIEGERNNLEYIDLRSENKVFYKYKEGTQEEIKVEEEKKSEEQPKMEEKKKKKK